MGTSRDFLAKHRRNDALFDVWSIVHFGSGVVLGWVVDPFIGLLALVLWEPFEVLLLSRIMARWKILYGHESLRNSLSDIVFDAAGVACGYWLLTPLAAPPFHWF